MNILQIHKYFWHRDGASNYAWDLSAALSKRGHEVIPFSMQHASNEPSPYARFFVSEMDLSDPARVSLIKKIRYAGRMVYSHEARRKLELLLKEHPVDVAHLHNVYHHLTPSILPVLKAHGIPIVMTLHDYNLLSPNYSLFHHGRVHEEDAWGWHWTCVKNKCVKNSRAQSLLATFEMIWQHKIKKYYDLVDRFLAPSQFMFDLCVKFGWPREKFLHLPLPIDAAVWVPVAEEGNYVTYIGRLSEEKGLSVLLEAARLTPQIQYKIIGTGPDATKLQQAAADLPNVHFVGFKTGPELHALIAQARLLVLPAVWYENCPISVLEAKAMGKIMIASAIGGLPELLPSELLVPPGNPAALAERITRWYTAPAAARREVGLKLRQEVEYHNSLPKHLGVLERLYTDVLRG